MISINTSRRLRAGSALSAVIVTLLATQAPLAAQTGSGAPAAGDEPTTEIIVTGSRIARPDTETAAPISFVGADEIGLQAGSVNIENVLNDLPQVTATTSSVSNNPGGGVATVNLRALGSGRTLVLVDGRRYVSYDVSQTVDLNTIPAALVERVDVVTGGRSAVYGSDSIAGVVNFVLKKNFAGAELNSSYNVSQRGDSQIWDISGTIGANFDDNRGNVVTHIGYTKRKPTFAGERAFGRITLSNTTVGGVPTQILAGSPSVPQLRILQTGLGALLGFSTDNVNFRTDGSAAPFVDATDSYNATPVNYLQVPQERFIISTSARYEVTSWLQPYLEGQFINNRVSTLLAATPIGNSTPFGNGSLGALKIQTQSPFLSPAVRTAFAQLDAAEPLTSGSGVNTTTRGDGYILLPSFGFRTVSLGGRGNTDDRNAYRIVAGLKGDLGGGFSYDGYYMFARTKNAQRQAGNIAISNFLASTTTAYQNGATVSPFPIAGVAGGGTLVCADSAARTAGCVPANIFGQGNISQAAINYLAIGATNLQEYQTQVASFALTNPSLFNFGTGDVGIAVGAEWREEKGRNDPDQYLSSGNVAGFNPSRPTAGSYSVKEAFAELNVPLVDKGFIYKAELNLAGRVSDYSNAPGTVYTYAAGGIIAPIRDISFRGQYSRAIRGPSVNELFLGNTVSFAGNIDNGGCGSAAAAPGGALNAVCVAQGVPASVLADPTQRANLASTTIVNPPTSQGGNPTLKEETADTWTAGVVLAPTFLSGFTATVDYYNIKIKDYISTVGTQNIGTACFVQRVDVYCSRITRNSLGQIERIDDRNANSGGLKTNGIDVGASYNYKPGSIFGVEGARIGFNFQGSRLLKYDYTPVAGLAILNRCAGHFGRLCSVAGASSVGAPLPKWRHSARVTAGTAAARLSLQWRYLGAVTDDNPAITYPVERLPSKSYFDLSANLDAFAKVSFTFGVSNLFDIKPPLLATSQNGGPGEQTNTFPAVYDVIGRSFFVSGKVRF